MTTDASSLERKLAESEQRYQSLLEATSDYVYSVDLSKGAARTSHGLGCEAVTGYSQADFTNDPYLWYRVVHEEDRQIVQSQIDRILTGKMPPVPLEHRIVHKNGSVRWIRNTTIPHLDNQGQFTGYDGLISDITERKLAEAQLREANANLIEREVALKDLLQNLHAAHQELKQTQLELIQAAKLESLGTLAAGVAHEVQNPLQIILLGLNYLDSRLAQTDENLGLTLTEMRDAVKRANTIIRELLTLSANSEFHLVPQDLTGLIDRSLLLIKNLVVSSQIKVKLELSSDLPLLQVDPPKLEQVFINIFINSLQAMPPGGTLTVRCRLVQLDEATSRKPIFRKFALGDKLLVTEVQDTGSGLTEAELARAFDPFFTTKPVGVGTGLGLSVAKNIVEAHGGNIEIKNAPGGGALVTIVLKT
jgi:PAS domain S-box-containing protein